MSSTDQLSPGANGKVTPSHQNLAERSDSKCEDLDLDKENSSRLKDGIMLRDFLSEDGATFETECSQPEELYFDSGLLDYAKHELVDGDDSSSSENNGEEKPYMTPFEKLAQRMVDVSPDKSGGILKKITKDGIGGVVPTGALVQVHYNAYLELSAEPFDSSPLRGPKARFRLNNGFVIEGLDIAISTMRMREKAQFLVSHEFAYGPMGCPPRIPPQATVLFEVELFHFVDNAAVAEYNTMTSDEKNHVDFTTLLDVCRAEHRTGNHFFGQEMYQKCLDNYSRAIRMLETRSFKDKEEETQAHKLLLKLYQNIAMAYERLGKWKKVITFCREALKLDKNSAKSHYRLGKIMRTRGDYAYARMHLVKANRLLPHDTMIQDELKQLNKKQEIELVDEKKMCQRMFGGLALTNGTATAKSPAQSKASEKQESTESSSGTGEVADGADDAAEFRKLVEDTLEELACCNTPDKRSFPVGLSGSEVSFIRQTALDLGLQCEGSTNQAIVVTKT